jgi:transcriptional regulator with PAS, ATPase and Fis domain
MAVEEKKRILFISMNEKFPLPSSRIDPQYYLFSSLLKCHEWQREESHRICAIFVDLDSILQTHPLDEWAIRAWRNTFNEVVVRCLAPGFEAPTLVAFTADANWESAILAVQCGARDLTKLSKIEMRIQHYLQLSPTEESESNVTALDRTEQTVPAATNSKNQNIASHTIPFPIEGLEGSSLAIESVRSLIRKSASLETSILIEGETGTGKELVAKALHKYSRRNKGPFVAVNCGAIAPHLIEAELFGHSKGAFTGADRERVGLVASAHEGSLFLDDISLLPLDFQVKLLRVLQDKKVKPVGSSQEIPVDIRLISSTKENLETLVEAGKFREDLLYRIRVMDIPLPNLRERKSDIPLICQSVLRKLARRNKRPVLDLNDAVLEKFLFYSWPGNIRELENVLEHGATLCWAEARGRLELKDLPATLQMMDNVDRQILSLKDAVRQFEREYIARTIKRLGGSKEEAAETLGLSLATLYRKLG